MNKTHVYQIGVAVLAASGLAISSCDRGQQETADFDTTQQAGEQVIEREVTPQDSQLGGTAVERGETEAQAEREVVTREQETLQEDLPTITMGQEQLDVNRMESEDFVVLGLDEQSADRIIKYRDENGPFSSFEELSQVPGIDTNWLNQYRDRFAFHEPEGESQEQQAGQEGQSDMMNP